MTARQHLNLLIGISFAVSLAGIVAVLYIGWQILLVVKGAVL
jgi:hypothetical protein